MRDCHFSLINCQPRLSGALFCNSELKQVTFLTTPTAWVTSEDWVKGCDWWKTSILLPVDVRVVKNLTCLIKLTIIIPPQTGEVIRLNT
jgi:hypothetical protein